MTTTVRLPLRVEQDAVRVQRNDRALHRATVTIPRQSRGHS